MQNKEFLELSVWDALTFTANQIPILYGWEHKGKKENKNVYRLQEVTLGLESLYVCFIKLVLVGYGNISIQPLSQRNYIDVVCSLLDRLKWETRFVSTEVSHRKHKFWYDVSRWSTTMTVDEFIKKAVGYAVELEYFNVSNTKEEVDDIQTKLISLAQSNVLEVFELFVLIAVSSNYNYSSEKGLTVWNDVRPSEAELAATSQLLQRCQHMITKLVSMKSLYN